MTVSPTASRAVAARRSRERSRWGELQIAGWSAEAGCVLALRRAVRRHQADAVAAEPARPAGAAVVAAWPEAWVVGAEHRPHREPWVVRLPIADVRAALGTNRLELPVAAARVRVALRAVVHAHADRVGETRPACPGLALVRGQEQRRTAAATAHLVGKAVAMIHRKHGGRAAKRECWKCSGTRGKGSGRARKGSEQDVECQGKAACQGKARQLKVNGIETEYEWIA